MKFHKKQLLSVAKFIISFGLIYIIFKKINFEQVLSHLNNANYLFLIVAILFFILSKVFASFRLNLYFHNITVKLSQINNLKLYILGMFYNLFLPGGIGGDAYKVWFLKQNYKVKTKKLASSVFVDRLSGMLLLYILAAIISLTIKNKLFEKFDLFIIISIPFALITFWLLNKYIFISGFNVFWKSIGYSFFVQASQIIAVFFILKALHIESNTMVFLFIFLISSILSIMPITIGGIGLRETTFFYASSFFALNVDISISISMLFFLIQAFVSLFGIYYHIKTLKLAQKEI